MSASLPPANALATTSCVAMPNCMTMSATPSGSKVLKVPSSTPCRMILTSRGENDPLAARLMRS
ncbi:hypothetical protein X742_01810 [Mesorhizobium sp. LNHC232B00]|nr:hypothetical protein X742_01810 [Mesorhizobium sp. LNHC232B00]